MAAEGARLRGVASVPGRPKVGQVLVQGAAAGDVEQLQAAADAEHRHPARAIDALDRGRGPNL
jgi:hypothetical protein